MALPLRTKPRGGIRTGPCSFATSTALQAGQNISSASVGDAAFLGCLLERFCRGAMSAVTIAVCSPSSRRLAVYAAGLLRAAVVINLAFSLRVFARRRQGIADELQGLHGLAFRALHEHILCSRAEVIDRPSRHCHATAGRPGSFYRQMRCQPLHPCLSGSPAWIFRPGPGSPVSVRIPDRRDIALWKVEQWTAVIYDGASFEDGHFASCSSDVAELSENDALIQNGPLYKGPLADAYAPHEH